MLNFILGFFVFVFLVTYYGVVKYLHAIKLRKIEAFKKGNINFKNLRRYAKRYARIYKKEYQKALKKNTFLSPNDESFTQKVREKIYKKGIDEEKFGIACLYYSDIYTACNDLENIFVFNKIHEAGINGYSVCENTKEGCFVLIFIQKVNINNE